MRMWNVPPKWLCRKHLLGEHVEMHMFVGAHKRNTKLDGFINTGLLNHNYIAQRHDMLAAEMQRRGYNHKSPIDLMVCEDIADTYHARGFKENVKVLKNTEELRRRCPECDALIKNSAFRMQYTLVVMNLPLKTILIQFNNRLNNMENVNHFVVSLSGGMDSSTLLLHCLKRAASGNGSVTALSFDYGQKHRVELEKAQDLVNYLQYCGYKLVHKIIKLDGLTELLHSSLVSGGAEVPEGHYAQENMKDTVVPNRNKIFASITQAVALSIANQKNVNVAIALGIHAGDHAIYPDCRQEFRDADEAAFKIGNWDSERVNTYAPYLDIDKYGILKDGWDLCLDLGLNFDKVYRMTNTSYKPINIDGAWYADYKSASSVERILAFDKLGRPDPAPYADETGPVSWDIVMKHANKIEEDFNNLQLIQS